MHKNNLIRPASEAPIPVPEEILTLHNLQFIDIPNQFPLISGVYFLVYEGVIVYVGKSTDVVARISTHVKEDIKLFQNAFFINVPEKDLSRVESAFIHVLKPYYNERPGQATKSDWRIISGLSFREASAFEMTIVKPAEGSWYKKHLTRKWRAEKGFKAGDVFMDLLKPGSEPSSSISREAGSGIHRPVHGMDGAFFKELI